MSAMTTMGLWLFVLVSLSPAKAVKRVSMRVSELSGT